MNNAIQKNESKRDLRTLIQSDAVKQQLAMVLPKHLTSDRMARVACTTIMRVPKLSQCTPESLLNCLMQCSQLGLEPDGRRAHLIPFENRQAGTVECTLIIDWKGLAELALRGGTITKLHADLICDKDEFAYDLGDILHHKINFRESRGEPYAAYAMAVTKTGEKFVAVMTKEEIEKIRDGSQGWRAFQKGWAKQSPWQDSPGEMWKKTTFRRLSKWLPLSPEYRDAMEADDEPLPTVSTHEEAPPIFGALPESTGQPEAPHAPTSEVKTRKKKETPPVDIASAVPAPEPEQSPNPNETEPEKPKSFEEIVDETPPSTPVTAQESPLSALREAIAKANISEAQVIAYWNKNKGPDRADITDLASMPVSSVSLLVKHVSGNGAVAKAIREMMV